MKKVSLLTLIFTLLFAVFFLVLVFFRIPFPLYPLMSYQDAFDHLTPLVLIPLYWLMFRAGSGAGTNRRGEIAFMVMAALWVLGHGMHLAANSVDNLIENMANNGGLNIKDTDIYTLTYFMDENLSHYLWHGGILGMAALLGYSEWRGSANLKTTWWVTILAGILYGFSSFLVFIEGQTVYMSFPFTIIFSLVTLIWGRKLLSVKPVLAFFFIACLVAALLFTGWGLYWGAFPEPSAKGLI